MAAGVDGIFLETHENPAKAPSDGPNQIPHKNLPAVLHSLLAIHNALA
jgi:2-dehydro-3-deoxyphosphooctonate aldolase (KDO 8-P synthase)